MSHCDNNQAMTKNEYLSPPERVVSEVSNDAFKSRKHELFIEIQGGLKTYDSPLDRTEHDNRNHVNYTRYGKI